MHILRALKHRLLASPFIRNLNDMRYQRMELFYNPEDLTSPYYERIKDLGFEELEHQIGRLTNFRAIINTIADRHIKGDFIEFGTWRGFSLLWTAYFCQRAALFDRSLIGVDGYVGLPHTDGVFWKGQFSDVSRKQCERNLKASHELYGEIQERISIHQSLFEETAKMTALLRGKKVVFVHIDCDIGSAAQQLFQLIHDTDCLADECFILFDDYGCESSLRQVVDKQMRELERKWTVTVHSSTKLTKNYHLRKR